MSTYAIYVQDDGSGNFNVVAMNAPSTKPSGGTNLTIPFATNNNAAAPVAITGATNATPIVLTVANSWNVGDVITVTGVLGNTAANGTWRLSAANSTTATLENSVGNASYTSGGYALKMVTTSRIAVAVEAAHRAILDDRASGN